MKLRNLSLKWIAVTLSAIIAIVDSAIYLYAKVFKISMEFSGNKSSVLLMVCFILLFLYRKRVNWFIGLGLCVYGLYNIIVIETYAAEPTTMDFTAAIYFLHKRNALLIIISLIPYLFYLTTIIVLLTKGGRRYYRLAK